MFIRTSISSIHMFDKTQNTYFTKLLTMIATTSMVIWLCSFLTL